jgi:non-ribosomal peptide synthetase-like protein
VFGDEEIRRGWLRLDTVRTGDHVFVGNDAVVPPGAIIPDNVLIGVKSKPPANEMLAPGDTWFGSPPIKLPTRQRVSGEQHLTFNPSKGAKIWRAVFELFRTSLPTMMFITFGLEAAYLVIYPLIIAREWGNLLVALVAVSVTVAVLQTLIVAGFKWLLMGVYKPVMKPMWSWWALRTEAIAVMYWGLGGKVLLDHLRCTPFLPWMLRLFGSKFGKGVCMDSTDITEFDCVSVGDFSVINTNAILQTHLFEDRVMKVGRLTLGKGVTVGGDSTVLYDTHIGDYARLMPLTVVMKGESIPAHSEWEGSPASPVVHAPEPVRQAA